MLTKGVHIAPSVLSADFLKLEEDLAQISSADLIHYDVMDGHFVPNLSFGTSILKQVKSASLLPVDVHLMVSNPEECVPWYLDCGADIVSFHWEAQTHAQRLVSLIHEAGAKASIALNPATPVQVLDAIIDELDMVLIMTVNPGFGGQKFIPSSLHKLETLKKLCKEHGVSPLIEVDGGISQANAFDVVRAGADVLVAGSAIFGSADRAQTIAELRQAGNDAVVKRA